MPNGPATSEVERLSGVERQFLPDEQQIVDGEPQTITQSPMPLIELAEPDKRMAPMPVTIAPTAEAIATGAAMPTYFVGQPILIVNRYNGGVQDWQELIRWDIPVGLFGDLHEMALQSSDDAHTRYRVVLGNMDQNLPTDRQTSTPLTWPWRNTKIPGGTAVYIQVRSTDGTVITVDGSITGTLTSLLGV